MKKDGWQLYLIVNLFKLKDKKFFYLKLLHKNFLFLIR